MTSTSATVSGTETVLPLRPRQEPPSRSLSNGVLGMILVVFVEVMLFAGFTSAFVIIKSGAVGSVWPPPNQPRLPLERTALNTAALILSGVVLLLAHRAHLRGKARVGRALWVAPILGALFVALQGVEWAALLQEGLTLTSSTYGSLFYTIIGAHAAHAVIAIGMLIWAGVRLRRGTLTSDAMSSVAIFWYFVVCVWPFLYAQVYF